MYDTWIPSNKARLEKPDGVVLFYQLFKDTRDIMCDDPRPDMNPVEEYMVHICEGHRKHPFPVKTVFLKGRDNANNYWRNAKKASLQSLLKT